MRGPRFKVNSITFEGKTDVSLADLRHALQLREGDFFSQARFHTSVDAINKIGLNVDKERDVRFEFDETNYQLHLVIIVDKRTSRLNSAENQLGRRIRRIFD